MKQRILLKGPFLSLSGYGYQARFALNAVRSREDIFDIYVINTGWGQTSWLSRGSEIEKYIHEKIIKTHQYLASGGKFDINLQITIPNEVEQNAPINILYTAGIETTRVAPQWLEKMNLLNKSIVVSNHSKYVFTNTSYMIQNQHGQTIGALSCNVPIDVVNYPVKKMKGAKINLELDYDFNFLTMAQWGPRKDIDSVIVNFLEEFWEDEVGLIVKTFIMNNSVSDRMHVEERLGAIVEHVQTNKQTEQKCKIYLLHGAMTDAELHSLYTYKGVSAFVTATHGEGFGLSIFESAYSGLPVLAPAWSGQCDFLFKNNQKLFTDIKFTLNKIQKEAVWEGVLQADSMWCYVDKKDLKEKMRYVVNNHDEVKEKAKKLKEHLMKEFSLEKKNEEFVNSILSVVPKSELNDDEIDQWLNDMNIDLIEAE